MSVEETIAWYSWVATAASSRKYYAMHMQALETLDARTLAWLVYWYGDQVYRANPNLLPRELQTLHSRCGNDKIARCARKE